MVYYMGVKHKAGGPRTGPAQTLWAGFDPLTAEVLQLSSLTAIHATPN